MCEWISRAKIHDRYIVWLVVAIKIMTGDADSELEEAEAYITEVENIERGRDDEGGPAWECGFCEFEDGDWEQLVNNDGDFSAIGLELTVDDPVDRFATFWRDTRPTRETSVPDGVALRSPLRFTT